MTKSDFWNLISVTADSSEYDCYFCPVYRYNAENGDKCPHDGTCAQMLEALYEKLEGAGWNGI